ncbi:MAG: hypothetical protein K6T17_03560 [Fimbriimonadales bacterium]|nr:hypothetical protein [Fimbriimonadales bacterium]
MAGPVRDPYGSNKGSSSSRGRIGLGLRFGGVALGGVVAIIWDTILQLITYHLAGGKIGYLWVFGFQGVLWGIGVLFAVPFVHRVTPPTGQRLALIGLAGILLMQVAEISALKILGRPLCGSTCLSLFCIYLALL